MRILFITLSNIGDVILTTAVLEQLKRLYPEATIDVLVGEKAQGIFRKDHRINEVIAYRKDYPLKEKWRLIKDLRQRNYDLVVDLRNTLIPFLIKAKRCFKAKRRGKGQHMLTIHLSALKDKIHKGLSLRPSIIWDEEDENYIHSLLDRYGIKEFIVIAPGARSSNKRWLVEKFIKLCELIEKIFPEKEILLVGDSNDYTICNEIAEKVKNCHNLSTKTSLTQLACLLSYADLLITNDSAVLHLGSAVNSPTLAIFGPTDENKYGPLSDKRAVVRKFYPCVPCEKAQCRLGDRRCLTRLTVEDVFDLATRLLVAKRDFDFTMPRYKRILLSRSDRIGDLIVTTPVIEVLHKKFPSSYLAFVLSPLTYELLKGHPYLDEIIVLDKKARHKGIWGSFRFIMTLRRKKFDLVITFHPTRRVHLLYFLAGIKKRIGYDWKWGRLNTDIIPHRKHLGERHELDYNFELLKAIGIEEISYNLWISRDSASYKKIEQLLKRNKISDDFIVIHPGASCPSKRWPAKYFAELIEMIINNYNFDIIVLTGPGEEEIAKEIMNKCKSKVKHFHNLSLSEVTALLDKSELMITNDSGPMHIASALKRPVVAIFGRNQPGLSYRRWGPLGDKKIILHKYVGCENCLAHNCKKGFKCLWDLKPIEVFKAFEKLLEETIGKRCLK